MADATRPLTNDSADSLVGKALGNYTVLSLLGAGGMGEVYRAHDSRLGRDVAVKVLPALASYSDSARSRFHREAQAIAAISHPNIRSLYDVGESNGRAYAVMELLDGETLRGRLARGPLSLRKALETAAAVADGIAAAHASGIVHRDLKPENIFITVAGQVKVLDFGLAKITAPLDEYANSQTVSGVVLGTPSYMSPEQVSAHGVDARTDIFAFGCVLYEMVTGQRAFASETHAETMTAILHDEPPAVGTLSAEVRRIVEHCLEKQPDARFQSAQDLAFHIRGLLHSADAERPIRASVPPLRLWPVAAALALITILLLSIARFRQTEATPRQVHFDISPPPNASFTGAAFALSPDGDRLAFVASGGEVPAHRRLWVHSLETGESLLVPGVDDIETIPPVWSPDGRFIAFVSEGKIKKIAPSGGSAQTVVDGPNLAVLAWSADDIIVFNRGRVLMKVSAAGEPPTALTSLDPSRGEILHSSARFLPDGRHFLYERLSLTEGMSGVFIGSLDATPEQQDSKRLVAHRGSVAYAPSLRDPRIGHLLFNRNGTLWAQPFDAGHLALRGEATPVVEQIGESDTPTRPGFFTVSRNGALAYRRQEIVAGMLSWLDPVTGKTTPLLDTPLTRPAQLRLSPDGRRLAIIVAGDVWVYDLGGRPPIKLTSGGGNDMPLWTPDGTRVVYARSTQPFRLFSVPADSAGATPEPVSPDGHFHPHGWSVDGRELITVLNTYSATGWDILGIPTHEKRNPTAIVRTPSDEGMGGAALSPDGRWLAYTSNATGDMEIWMQPYPSGATIRVSPHGGADPQWARDGQTLYYVENKKLMAVAIENGTAFNFKPPVFLIDLPELRQRFPVQSYDVAPDGRFITIVGTSTRSDALPISMIVNWMATPTK